MRHVIWMLALVTSFVTVESHADPSHQGHAHGHAHHAEPATIPKMPGEDAFGAIGEIIAILEADPNTDWEKVNIDALALHLRDMQFLMSDAQVATENLSNGLRMRISREGRGGDAAGRMIPAHAPILQAETGWQTSVAMTNTQITFDVTSPDPIQVQKIRAFGFFGVMAAGAHHQPHHLMMARGELHH